MGDGSASSESRASLLMRDQGRYTRFGEFVDPELETKFVSQAWPEVQARARAALLASFTIPASTILDFMALGASELYFELLAARIVAILLCCLAVLVFAQKKLYTAFCYTLAIAEAYIFAVVLFALGMDGFDPSMLMATVCVILVCFFFGAPNRVHLLLAVGLASSLGFIAYGSLYLGLPSDTVALMAILLAALNILGVYSLQINNKMRRSEFLTTNENKAVMERLRREITDRWQAEGEARSNALWFQSVFRAAPLPLVLVRPSDSKVLQANKAAMELFGLTAVNADGFDLKGYFTDGEQSLEAIGRSLEDKSEVEVKLSTREGREIWTNVSGAAIRYKGASAILLGIQDITERRQEAEALRAARDHADAVNRSKTEFLANMSHELRTPLNAIIGFSETINRGLFGPIGNERYREYAQDIHHSGVHLLNVINDILDLSKIEAGHFDLFEEEVDLDDVFGSTAIILKPRAEQAGVALTYNAEVNGEFEIYADGRAIKQVLINLISNAVKFSDEGDTVHIGASIHQDTFRIYVRDEGVGMAPEDIPKALAPFTQVDGSLSRSHEGTGLGLPLAMRLVELHDGELIIESTRGEGTTVYIELPLSRLLFNQGACQEALF